MQRRNFLRTSTAMGAGTLASVPAASASASAASPQRERGGRRGRGERGERPLRVHVVMFDGVEEQDFAAPYEVFAVAGAALRYVRVDGPGQVTCAHGTKVVVDHGWAPREADVLVVPGGGAGRNVPGVAAEIERGVLPRALAAAPRPGLTITSVCTGALLLAAAGLCKGRPCTTHHNAKKDLEERGGLVKPGRVVDDGDLVTAGGITSGLELGLWLVRREIGAEKAIMVEYLMEYEARGTVRE